MRITVRYLAQLRRLSGRDTETIEIDGRATLADLLAHLAGRRGEDLRRILLDHAGQPHRSLLVFLGEDQVRSDSAPPLSDGDVVTLLTPMAGG